MNTHTRQTMVLDARACRHLAYLQRAYTHATGNTPSASQVMRYALARLAAHVSDLAVKGRTAGVPGFTDVAREREAREIGLYARSVPCGAIQAMTAADGSLLTFNAAVGAQGVRSSLSIPVKR